MDFDAIYHFLFETFEGIGCLIGVALVLSILVSFILERRTRKRFANQAAGEDDWSFFDDDSDEPDEKSADAKQK